MTMDTRGRGPDRGGWAARNRIDRAPRQTATAVARWISRVAAARTRRKAGKRLPPPEDLQRHGEAHQAPGQHDGELWRDGGEAAAFGDDPPQGLVEGRQGEGVDERLHGVREALGGEEYA